MDEYVTLTEAAKRLGVSRWTLYRRIDELGIPVYDSPVNRRVKLVKRSDVEGLLTPVLAATGVARVEQKTGR